MVSPCQHLRIAGFFLVFVFAFSLFGRFLLLSLRFSSRRLLLHASRFCLDPYCPDETQQFASNRSHDLSLVLDLPLAWERSNVNQRQELIKSFFPEGLVFSTKNGCIEPANTILIEMFMGGLEEEGVVGVPDGI